ncbi:MAG: 2-oxoacid:acceptor oxidoreductase family protein [Deltaproteobacteria bacterium]|nr:2-oxoacid:acceptor oxidoreductase family protein [Deltaproteobacteria bacterium]
MKEIKIFGRGGQGVVTGAQILATAAFIDGLWSQTFPQFGAERRGAPVIAYVRVASELLKTHDKIYNPDVVVVMDSHLFKMGNPLEGIKAGGRVIVNCRDEKTELTPYLPEDLGGVFAIDATTVAHQLYGKTTIPITNIIIVGAYCAAEKDMSLESVYKALPDYFPEKRVEVNRKAARMGYENLRGIS